MPPKKQTSSSALTADKQTLKKQTSSRNANRNAHDADDSDHQAMAPPSKSLKKQTSKILDQQTPAATAAAAAPAKISPPVKQASLKKTYFEMIVEAIKHLNKGKSGSSKQAIEKWVRENYALEESACNKGVKNALNANVENKNLWQVTGKGASGSFALMSDRPKKVIAAAAAAAAGGATGAKDKKEPSKSATASKKKATVQVEKENESDEEDEEEPVVAKKTGKGAAASKSVPKVASKTKSTLPKKTVAKKAVEKVASKSQGSAAAKANSKKEAKNDSEQEDEEEGEDEEEEEKEEETHQVIVI